MLSAQMLWTTRIGGSMLDIFESDPLHGGKAEGSGTRRLQQRRPAGRLEPASGILHLSGGGAAAMAYGALLPVGGSNNRHSYTTLPDTESYIEISPTNFGRQARRGSSTWKQAAALTVVISGLLGVAALWQSMGAASGAGAAAGGAAGGAGGRAQTPLSAALPPAPPGASAAALYAKVQAKKAVRFSAMSDDEKKDAFENFRTLHGKKYATVDERGSRFEAFKSNLELIDKLNDANPLALFAVNEYADMTGRERQSRRMTSTFAQYDRLKGSLPAELLAAEPLPVRDQKQQGGGVPPVPSNPNPGSPNPAAAGWLGANSDLTSKSKTDGLHMSRSQVGWLTPDTCAACNMYPELAQYTMTNMPASFDWRSRFSTPVSSQGYCGSCWTFSTAADIEGKWFLATGETVELSKQQLVECDQRPGAAEGCNGGFAHTAFQYISKTGGLLYEADYPYKNVCAWGDCVTPAKGTPTCDKATINTSLQSGAVAHIGGWQMVALGAQYESALALALLKNGPISIALNAVGMEYYVHGITGCPETVAGTEYCKAGAIDITLPCEPTMLDHAVLLVGYGEEDGVPFWVIKNSWGEWWGETGYYRIVRGENHCGVSNFAVTSVVKSV